ncbi:MAG TPA: ABC transporter permease [Chloroflexota bacterium]|nr:ABC transporter permease [Chloroflexota bacterium]
MPVWTFTRLTLHEASRNRLLAIAFGLTLVYVALVGWGAHAIADHSANLLAAVSSAAGLELVVFFFGSFMLVLLAVFVSGHSIRQESESGLLQAVLTKPVRRLDLLAGRWLGSALVLTGWVALFTVGVVLGVGLAVGFYPPHPVQAGALMLLESLVILSLRLLFGSFLGTLASGIVPLLIWGLARIAGLVETVGKALNISSMVTAGIVTSLIVPTDVLARGSSYELLPAVLSLAGQDVALSATRGNPFVSVTPVAGPMLIWSVLYVVVAFALGARIFSRRDV